MIAQFGIRIALLLAPAPTEAPPPPPPPVQIVKATVVELSVPTYNGEPDPALQGPEDAVTCSYVSDGTPGTGEAGQEYTFQTGRHEAAVLGLACS